MLNGIPPFRIPVEKAQPFRNTASVLQPRTLKSGGLKLSLLKVHAGGSLQPVLRAKMPELDSLRGIACLMVLVFHGFGNHYTAVGLESIPRTVVQISGYGWTGVNLFFVLSGFLITGILLNSREERGYYKRFYIRRVLRILPAYLGVILLLIGLSSAEMIDREVSWSFIGLSLVYLSNLTQFFGVPLQYGVLWSLAVEEHFYLLWPTCVKKLNLLGTTIAAGTICILALACRIAAAKLGYNVFGYETWLVADGLGMGALLAIAARAFRQNRMALWRVSGAAAAVAAGCFLIDHIAEHTIAGGALHVTGINSFYASIVTATILLGSRFGIRLRGLEFFGDISYGLYLVHPLCFDLYDHFSPKFWVAMADGRGNFGVMTFRLLAVSSLAIALATVSRRFYEERFLRLKGRLAPLPSEAQGEAPCSSSAHDSVPVAVAAHAAS